jgi:hypothetical protein
MLSVLTPAVKSNTVEFVAVLLHLNQNANVTPKYPVVKELLNIKY